MLPGASHSTSLYPCFLICQMVCWGAFVVAHHLRVTLLSLGTCPWPEPVLTNIKVRTEFHSSLLSGAPKHCIINQMPSKYGVITSGTISAVGEHIGRGDWIFVGRSSWARAGRSPGVRAAACLLKHPPWNVLSPANDLTNPVFCLPTPNSEC